MHYLIDGYNLLFLYFDESSSIEKGRDELILHLQYQITQLHLDVTLIFDGSYNYGETSGLEYWDPMLVAFSFKGQTADEYILEKLSYQKCPANFTVVTSDKKLQTETKLLGAKVKSTDSFIHWLHKKAQKLTTIEKDPIETPKNMERLLNIFEKRLKDK